MVLLHVPPVLADAPQDEVGLKSAFVFNLAKFTYWPVDLGSGPAPDLVLCTTGEDELVDALQGLNNETIRGRSVTIRPTDAADGFDGCQVLYIAGSEYQHFARLLRQLGDAPTLTISEIRGFADADGIIQLYRAENRVRFKINLAVARAKRLKLSARLLDLAEMSEPATVP